MRTKPTIRLPSLAPLCVTLVLTSSAWAAPPELMRYQVRLSDDAGVPLSGPHDLVFAIYDDPSAGSQLWSEGPRSVELSNGVADIVLGEATPLPSSVFTDPGRWLEVTVDGKVLSPRQRLVSVPYAHTSDRLGSRTLPDIDAISPPIGAVLPYFGAVVDLPGNWTVCDGSTVSDPDSPLNGVTLPDLRSHFVRGEADSLRDIVGSGANTGGTDDIPGHSHTTSKTGEHPHAFMVPDHRHQVPLGPVSGGTGNNVMEGAYTLYAENLGGVTSDGGQHEHTTSAQPDAVDGNIPRYVALHYIIRIK